jgi:K+-transporting ATPase A subunit
LVQRRILRIALAAATALGRMVNDERQGWALFAAMGILLLIGVVTVYWAEARGNPALAALRVDAAPNALQAGGNMEGKEVCFGIAPSALCAKHGLSRLLDRKKKSGLARVNGERRQSRGFLFL